MSHKKYLSFQYRLMAANNDFDYSKLQPSSVSSKPLHERAPKSQASTQPTTSSSPKVNLGKIRLDKGEQSTRINLNKSAPELLINLTWTQKEVKKSGLFGGLFSSNKGIDLDLGAYFRLIDGSQACIDALQFSKGRGGPRHKQTRQGCFDNAPYLWHTGDDRQGGAGESILVNPKFAHLIDNIVVYTYIYDNNVVWSETDAVVSIKASGQEEIEVHLGNENIQGRFVVLAHIHFNNGQIHVERKMLGFNSLPEIDKYFGWGFSYSNASK
ncbi:stress protein [Psittacicella gerlachiana]|uniref:Uncharacterized protein n=1 Tax=Psittacicella gerlachiana TaxID=2028574 RepID=A0A3A1YGJ2_9GAMM|nr:stress protein [Psittacicella gerlachiana]RIY35157.1 hypothetical protein CKF59_04025 [Psittacicella gerlachiana]